MTAWAGSVYYVTADGKVDTIFDLTAAKKNTADIDYDAEKDLKQKSVTI